MTPSGAPLYAVGMSPDETDRLQAALSRLLGRPVSDDERVADTLIDMVDTIGARLSALEGKGTDSDYDWVDPALDREQEQMP